MKIKSIYRTRKEDVVAISMDMVTIDNALQNNIILQNALTEHCRIEVEAIDGIVKELEKQVTEIANKLGIDLSQ